MNIMGTKMTVSTMATQRGKMEMAKKRRIEVRGQSCRAVDLSRPTVPETNTVPRITGIPAER
jgi:hypothetical protein